jgi:heat shock protein HslJ
MPVRRVLTTSILLCSLLAAGCGSSGGGDDPGDPSSASVDGRTFVGDDLRIEFADGRLGADAGCNLVGADYRIEQGRLVTGALSMTEMACPGRDHRDQWLVNLLTAEPEVRLEGGQLTLRTDTETVVLLDREVAEPDRALIGPRWELTTIIEAEVASSVPVGVEAWMEFSPDGTIGFHNGCNSGGGLVEVDGTELVFGNLETTLIGCAGDPATVEMAFNAVVGGAVGYEIEASTLRLRSGNRGLDFAAE